MLPPPMCGAWRGRVAASQLQAASQTDWPIFPNRGYSLAQIASAAYIAAAMPNKNNNLYRALLNLLRPLARLFLRVGVGYREYCELSKAAFVAVAAEEYGVHGRPTNASRIAAMTGLTRKEISRIRKRIDRDEATQTSSSTPIAEVLAAWQTKDEFLDSKGRPRALPLEGKRGSFRSLVRQFAGDIPDGAMRKELQRIGAAELDGDALRWLAKEQAELDAAAETARVMLERAAAQLDSLARGVSS